MWRVGGGMEGGKGGRVCGGWVGVWEGWEGVCGGWEGVWRVGGMLDMQMICSSQQLANCLGYVNVLIVFYYTVVHSSASLL